jgi:probable F420-dependent oxidoreductase
MTAAADLAYGFSCTVTRDTVTALERLPIDSLWVGGHVASHNPTGEAMVELARLSALADRVRIGTAVLLLPLYSPAIVAKQVADLDRATQGRVILGVGVGGEYPQDFRACEVDIARRGARADEAIPLLRDLWTAGTVSHHGANFDLDDVRIHPSPHQIGGPPIVVAGRQVVAMRRAARLGDGWMPYLYSPERYAKSVAMVKQFAAEAERALIDFEWFAYVFVNVDDDSTSARAEAAAFLGGNYRQDFEAMLDRVAVAGSPAQVAERINAFVEAGVRHLVFTIASKTRQLPIAEVLAGDVMPQFARRSARVGS